ncbi:MAG TPA: metallopeptidase TldD-related protein [Polyangiaceae bacterium]|nr:metallopeptidase TldD-related protein [Polyangiaceae bacterium]
MSVSGSGSAREAFFSLADHGASLLRRGEELFCHFAGERSDFVRFNHGKVRQAMTVEQGHVSLSLSSGAKRDVTTLALSRDPATDRARVEAAIVAMRASVAALPEDPYHVVNREPSTSDRREPGALASPEEAVSVVVDAASGTDFVGLYSSGEVQRGLVSSLGHRHFHEVGNFQLDFSLYERADKAVSRAFSSATWNAESVRAEIGSAREVLPYLARPEKKIPPGAYRAFLSPAALVEIVGMLNWGGVSEKAQRTKTSCLAKLVEGEERLSPKVTLRENTAEGLAPGFDELGFVKPPRVDVVVEGKHRSALAGPRTAREYGIAPNADGEETLRAADLAPGELPEANALRELGTGIWVGNLWYLGFSDRMSARLTGMTRFSTFWVEDGEIVAPLAVMRFDDGLYRLLGSELVDLTQERKFLVSTQSYERRSVETYRLPGALVSAMTFTL